MYDSIIFDMDGTLVDMLDAIVIAWNDICSKNKWELHVSYDQMKSLMGLNAHDIGGILFPDLSEEDATKRVEYISLEQLKYYHEHKGKTYIPNEEFLKELSKNHKLYIVSNCLKGYIETFYENFGYGKYFIDFRNISNGKTKAQNIKDIVDTYHIDNPVYIGDTISDYKAALEAKVPFIHAAYGFGEVENVTKIKDITELLNY